jgi:hypothetical protein
MRESKYFPEKQCGHAGAVSISHSCSRFKKVRLGYLEAEQRKEALRDGKGALWTLSWEFYSMLDDYLIRGCHLFVRGKVADDVVV